MTLFPYQFDVIPVELISSIYEQFAHADPVNTGTGTETDIFYTRLSLVSLVLDEVMDGLTGAETVLDLTCGSGVFLVEALRRLVVRLRANGGAPSRELLRSTLHGQIQGDDVSKAAVRVAAFSLYLAALELDPDPRPPQALRFEPLIGKTLIVGDAWAVEHTPEGNAALTTGGNPCARHCTPATCPEAGTWSCCLEPSPVPVPRSCFRTAGPTFRSCGSSSSFTSVNTIPMRSSNQAYRRQRRSPLPRRRGRHRSIPERQVRWESRRGVHGRVHARWGRDRRRSGYQQA